MNGVSETLEIAPCSVCGALVRAQDIDLHTDWHLRSEEITAAIVVRVMTSDEARLALNIAKVPTH